MQLLNLPVDGAADGAEVNVGSAVGWLYVINVVGALNWLLTSTSELRSTGDDAINDELDA